MYFFNQNFISFSSFLFLFLYVLLFCRYHSENDVLPNNENDQLLTNNIKRCTWSPGISLDKSGVDVLQLKMYTGNNRSVVIMIIYFGHLKDFCLVT